MFNCFAMSNQNAFDFNLLCILIFINHMPDQNSFNGSETFISKRKRNVIKYGWKMHEAHIKNLKNALRIILRKHFKLSYS